MPKLTRLVTRMSLTTINIGHMRTKTNKFTIEGVNRQLNAKSIILMPAAINETYLDGHFKHLPRYKFL